MFLNHSELCFADILFMIYVLRQYLFLNFVFNLNYFSVIRKYLCDFFSEKGDK